MRAVYSCGVGLAGGGKANYSNAFQRIPTQIMRWKDIERSKEMIRTINGLLSVIGKNIDDIQDPKVSQYDRQIKIERAQNTAALAKQFINACTLVQKADVMSGKHDRTDAVIGNIKNE